jgi:dihydropteroate synthase
VASSPGAGAPGRGHRFGARVLDATHFGELARAIGRTGSDPAGLGSLTRKARTFPVALRRVPREAAPLLQQAMLAVGGDAAFARGTAEHAHATRDVVLLATFGEYQRVLPQLRRQPFQLHPLADEIEAALHAFTARIPRRVPGAHRALALGPATLVMGVINATPDSFSDGGELRDPAAALARAQAMIADGAALIDVGGESTRPGASPVAPQEELRRIGPVIEGLAADARVPISVDTRHAWTAEQAIRLGADFVNDVGGLSDPEMRRVVRESGAAAIVMHMRGTPQTMATWSEYSDVRAEVFDELARATDLAEYEGIPAERLLVDPGIGFAKTASQSLELLAHVGEFRSLGYPVVVGASRKSFLRTPEDAALAPAERLEASLAAAVLAAEHGAHIVRAHDVRATVRALRLVEAIRAAADETGSAGNADWDGPID